MPISRREFENSPDEAWLSEIVQFLKSHKDEAFTEAELMELFVQRPSKEKSLMFHEEITVGVEVLDELEKRTIKGIDYYAYKENGVFRLKKNE